MSRPVWGAWIEIPYNGYINPMAPGRAPYGARGLKSVKVEGYGYALGGRAPYGARGLK